MWAARCRAHAGPMTRRTRWWLLALAALVAPACTDEGGAAPDPTSTSTAPTETTTTVPADLAWTVVRPEVTGLTGRGDDQERCDDAADEQLRSGSVVLRSTALAVGRTSEHRRWLVCSRTLDDGGVDVLSTREVGTERWEVGLVLHTGLGHAATVVEASITDLDRAWITVDSAVGEYHEHLVTANGGRTWESVGWRPSLRASEGSEGQAGERTSR